MALCECGCGQETVLDNSRFCQGHNMLGEDVLGRRFGKVVVVKEMPKKGTKRMWLCVCDCGKETVKDTTKFTSGRATGCRSCNNGYKKRPFEGRYNMLVDACRRRGMECLLTYDEYLTFTEITECHYCGKEIVWKAHGDQGSGHKLDRTDNALGYSLKNCVVCCPRCNCSKSNDFTYEEWLQIGAVIRSWGNTEGTSIGN